MQFKELKPLDQFKCEENGRIWIKVIPMPSKHPYCNCLDSGYTAGWCYDFQQVILIKGCIDD